tara:strand:+ start:4844 stop:6796 length:1953 start_codon:yes stop_codon:yes gene_type:complete
MAAPRASAMPPAATERGRQRPFGRLCAVLNVVGAVWMSAIMLLVLADVFGRNVLGAPIAGVPELVAYSLAGSVFLQMPNTLLTGRFVRAELFIQSLEARRPIAAAVFNLVFNTLGVALFVVVLYQLFGQFAADYAAPERNSTGVRGIFLIPNWPLTLIITSGVALTLVTYALRAASWGLTLRREVVARQEGSPVGWVYIAWLTVAAASCLAVFSLDLTRFEIGALSFLAIIAFVLAGIDIAIGLIGASFLAIWLMMGTPAVAAKVLKLTFDSFLRDYFFGVVPLFVLMGLILKETDIAADMFQMTRWMLRGVRGGLGVATVLANAIFAAITGSSIASAAVFSKIATPELLRHGYSPRFSVGVVAGSSVLGMLIPPSLLLIVYGFIAQVSVGVLFIAAIVPGMVLAAAMSVTIIGMARFWPAYVGQPDESAGDPESLGSAVMKLAPMLLLVTAVIGGIYAGYTTPVEAGAIGAGGALLIAAAMGRLDARRLWTAMIETGHVTVSILFLILAANVFTRMLALSGLPQEMAVWLSGAGLSFIAFMTLYIIVVIFLGMFLESVSLLLILVPFVLPIVETFGGDLVWFGIVTVVAVEMGLLTPPMGIACYVVRSTLNDPDISVRDVFAGAFPFTLIMLMVTLLLIAVPALTLVFV